MFSSIQHVNGKITPPTLPRFRDSRQNINKSTVKKTHLYTIFEMLKNIIFFNSTSQRQNHTTHSSRIYRFKQNMPYQQVNREKTHLYTFFWVAEICFFFFNSTSQQHYHTTHSPRIYRFRQNIPYQQVNREKNTPIYIFLSCWKIFHLQFNMSTGEIHHPFSQTSEILYPLFQNS